MSICLLVCCKNTKKNNDGKEIAVKINRGHYINTSIFCNEIEYINLGESSKNLIADISKLVKVSDTLYILDGKTQIIHKYTTKGDYISRFDRMGKGPGECVEISDFVVDTIKNWIYILDVGNPKIIVTDHNWNTIVEREKPGYFGKFEMVKSNTFIYYASNYINPDLFGNNQHYNLLVAKDDNSILNTHLPIVHINFHSSVHNQMVPTKGGVLVSPPIENEIYYANQDTCILKYKLNFKEYNPSIYHWQLFNEKENDPKTLYESFMSALDNINQVPQAIYINNMFENNSLLYFRFFLSSDNNYTSDGFYTVLHNKLTKNTLVGIPHNDIDYGLFGTPLAMFDDTLYTVIYPHSLKKRISQLTKSATKNPSLIPHIEKLNSLVEKNDEDLNPIIAKIAFKSEW